ncbi:hypothetical protein PYR76_14505 [Acinetobacter soli]|nr:hypothetical protein [Acinetobacter soli]WEH97492.1 hypothetical protein PYR76_14505 [Acinetobacter soli]
MTGVGVTLMGFFLVLQPSMGSSSAHSQAEEVVVPITPNPPSLRQDVETPARSETAHVTTTTGDEADTEIAQPKDSELSKLFSHTPAAAPVQRVSPFDQSLHATPKTATSPKPAAQATPKKPIQQSLKPIMMLPRQLRSRQQILQPSLQLRQQNLQRQVKSHL